MGEGGELGAEEDAETGGVAEPEHADFGGDLRGTGRVGDGALQGRVGRGGAPAVEVELSGDLDQALPARECGRLWRMVVLGHGSPPRC